MPTSPFSPSVQALTWIFFVIVFTSCLAVGHAKAWLKTFAYLGPRTDTDGDSLKIHANSRLIWLFMFYAYAHAYVRIIFICLVTSLVFIIVRLMLTAMPSVTSNAVVKKVVDKLFGLIDARNVMEFLHYRHWKYHLYAISLYLVVSLILSYILFGVPSTAGKKEEASRQYTRISVMSTTVVIVFYVAYTAKMIMVSSAPI